MTAGDFVRPSRKAPFTRERLLRGQERTSARPQRLWAAILLLGLTFLWVAVIWMAVFGSRPHTYLMLLAGTYTIGVLSGAGFSGLFSRRDGQPVPVRQRIDDPIEARVRPVR